MPVNRGVSGFWLDIDKLEAARTHIIGELGAKEGMFVYGVWVRLFTWQYQSGRPITGPEHIRNLTGLHGNMARKLWRSIPELLPRSVVRSDHGLLCRKTMGILEKYNKKQRLTQNQTDRESGGDSDSDSDSDLSSSLSPLETSYSESKTTLGRSVKSQTRRSANATTRKLSTGDNQYPDAFVRCWEARPKRAGSDDKKRAYRAWNARRKEGHDPESMQAGVQRYRAFCEKTDKIGTETVCMLSTFLGPADPLKFTQAWDPPARLDRKQANQQAIEDWINDGAGNTYEGEYEKH